MKQEPAQTKAAKIRAAREDAALLESENQVLEGDVLVEDYAAAASWKSLAEATVDLEARTIRNVALVGPESPSRRRSYPADTLRPATPLYEGAKVYFDHPPEGRESTHRSVRDLVARVQRPFFEEATGKVRGDLRVFSGPDGDKLLEVAKEDPGAVGMSHNALGAEKPNPARRGHSIVEKIAHVRSVDVVTEPSTTKGLFEGSGPHQEDSHDMDIANLTIAQLGAARAELVEEIREQGRKEVREKELADEQAKTKKLTEERDAVRRDLTIANGAKLLEEKLAAVKDLPEGAMNRVRTSLEALLEAGKEITDELVESAVEDTRAFLKDCGVELKEQKGEKKPGRKLETPITESKDGIPADDRRDFGEGKTITESAAFFGQLAGVDPSAYDEKKAS